MTDQPRSVAALDCGTNSTRLLIVGPQGQLVDRQMRVTRLGEGVDTTRKLSPEAIERTIEVLREYRRTMDANGVTRARMVATSAAATPPIRTSSCRPPKRSQELSPRSSRDKKRDGSLFAGLPRICRKTTSGVGQRSS